MLDWTLQLLNHAWAPWMAAGLLLVWGGGHWFAMQGNFFRPLHRQLVEMRHTLEETPEEPIAFAARYEELGEFLTRHALLTPAWTAFTRTIVVSPLRGTPLHGSREPSHFFNATALMGREAAQYYYNTIPNLLLGVGVLLTLIGLVAAIHLTIRGMASGDLYTTQTALMGLLNAASVKFLSSIAGFALALFFSWEEKRQRRRLERESEQICQLLLERMTWSGDEQLDRDQLQAVQTQSRHLQEIADRLHQVITQPTFQSHVGKAAEPPLQEEVAERLVARFEAGMSQLRETVGALGETIKTLPTPNLQPILANMQQEGERLLQANEQAMGRLVEGIARQFAALGTDSTLAALSPAERTDLLDQLAGRMERAMRNLEGATFAPFQDMAAQIERAVSVLEKRGTEGSAPSMALAMEQMLEGLREEGTRILSAHAVANERLLADLTRQGRLEGAMEGASASLLERIALRLEEAVAALTTHRPDAPSSLPATLLQRLTERMEEAVSTLVEKVGSGFSRNDLEPLLARMQHDGERLLQANTLVMERMLETVGRQIAGLQADASLAELHPDERTHVIDRLSARMEGALANLGDVGLSPFHRIAGQLEKAIATLDDRVARMGAPTDLTPVLAALREEGARMQMAHRELLSTLRSELVQVGSGEGLAAGSAGLPALLERLGLQLENALFALGERFEGPATTPGSLEGLLRAIRTEGAQLVRANEEAMQRIVEGIDRRFAEATATATLSELHPTEREGLLERVAVRMEQAVAGLGEVGLSPFFEGIRREMGQWTGGGQVGLGNALQSSFARITQQLDSVTAALESKVWAADTVSDMTPLIQAVRSEGERLVRANEQTLHRLFAELGQRRDAGFSGSAGGGTDLESLFHRIAREGERLVQANEASMSSLLNEVVRRFAGVSVTTALAELRPTERSELLDGVAVRMEQAVAGLGELGLTPFFDRMRHEIGQLIKANQQAVGHLMEEIGQRTREKGAQEIQLLESIVSQVGQAITRMGERFAASVPGTATLLSEEIAQAVRLEGERLQESQQRLFGQLETLLGQLAGMKPAFAATAPAPAGEMLAVLDIQSIQPLLDGWRQEGERLVMASEAGFERLLEEVGQQFAQLRGEGEVTVLEQLSTQLHDTIQAVRAPDSLEAQAEAATGGVAIPEGPESLRPVLVEMTRIMSRQRREEQRLLQQVVAEVNRAVAALDAKIGRATPLNLQTLNHTMQEMAQSVARQRGEEMRLLERVATEVNRAVAALDARIGRASPLQLKTLVDTVQTQGAEIVQALRGTRVVQGAPASEPVAAHAVLRTGENVLPGRREGLHALLAERPDRFAAPSLSPSPSPLPTGPGGGPRETKGGGAPESGLVVAYQSPFAAAAGVKAVSSSWVAARVEESAAQAGRGAAVESLRPRTLSVLRSRGEGPSLPVAVSARTETGEVPVVPGDLHPWVPAAVQEFGAKKGRAWQPFTVFVARQTADFLESQERFSLFK